MRYLPDGLGLSLLLFDDQGDERLRFWFRFLDWLCLIGICPLVFLQPFVVDAFILAVLAEAAPVSMLVEVLHHFLEIFLCLHAVIVQTEAKVHLYIDITLRSYGGLPMLVCHNRNHSLRHDSSIEAIIRFRNDKTILAILDDVIDG